MSSLTASNLGNGRIIAQPNSDWDELPSQSANDKSGIRGENMARSERTPDTLEYRRRLIAGIIAVAFLFQSIALFATGSRRTVSTSPHLRLTAQAQHSPKCPYHRVGGDPQKKSGECPMCQTLGCATPGSPVFFPALKPGERLIGLLAIARTAVAPLMPAYERALPRGPPIQA